MSQYKVSILIPVYNVSRYIERCAISLFSQTYDNLEYIFVDDCSPDNSISILKSIMKDYPKICNRVRIVSHETNKGLAAARNTALKVANGEFVLHVDSDDYVEETAVEKLVEEQVRSNADIVSGNAYQHTSSGTVELEEPYYISKDDMFDNVIKNNLSHVIWRRLIRKSLYDNYKIKAVEGFNQGEDWQVFPQLVYYAQSISKIEDFIYHYDCTNQTSYMNTGYQRSLCDQDIGSMNVVKSFLEKVKYEKMEEFKRVENSIYDMYLRRSGMNGDWEYFKKMAGLKNSGGG